MQPQYRDYNEVIVTIHFDEAYVVSNIHKKYGQNDNSHLQDLSIEVPSADPKNTTNTGYKGTLSIVDYKNVLFKAFSTYYTNNKGSKVQIPIEISIKCFTGNKLFVGVIDSWKLKFTGGPPSIDIQWKSISTFVTSMACNGTYVNPGAFIEAVINQTKGDHSSVKCIYRDPSGVDHDVSEFDNLFEFIYPDNIGYVLFDASKDTGGSGTLFYAINNFFIHNARLKSDGSQLTSNYEKSTFVIRKNSPSENKPASGEDDTISKLAFILNGSKPAYYQSQNYCDNRCVIPMTSFSYDIDNTNAILQFAVNGSANATYAIKDGSGVQITNTAPEVASTQQTRSLKSGDTDGNVEISFECYNVVSFRNNDTGAKIYFRLFTEYGEEHPITAGGSNTATVRSVSYSLSDAVIKANVTATMAFNTVDDRNKKVEPKVQDTNETKSGDNTESSSSQSTQ